MRNDDGQSSPSFFVSQKLVKNPAAWTLAPGFGELQWLIPESGVVFAYQTNPRREQGPHK